MSFFNTLAKYVHPTNRVVIKKIHYDSPGFVKLLAIKDIVHDIAVLVSSIIEAKPNAEASYQLVYAHYQKSRLTK